MTLDEIPVVLGSIQSPSFQDATQVILADWLNHIAIPSEPKDEPISLCNAVENS